MKMIRYAAILAIGSLVIGLPLLSQVVLQPWYTIDHGGGRGTSASFSMNASIGHPMVARGTASAIVLGGGYIIGIGELSGSSVVRGIAVESGWNMLSMPLRVMGPKKTDLFPTATSSAFAYHGMYVPTESLSVGMGYWVRFGSATTAVFSGSVVVRETIDVNVGWNLIGSLSGSLPRNRVNTSPPGLISSRFFDYTAAGGYRVQDTLRAGRGYWVKSSASGKLVFDGRAETLPVMERPVVEKLWGRSESGPRIESTDISDLPTLWFRNANELQRLLFFSGERPDLDTSEFLLPPIPPKGSFDVRYETHHQIACAGRGSTSVPIVISSAAYPLEVSWKASHADITASLLVEDNEIIMLGEDTMTIKEPAARFELRLAVEPRINNLPKTFSLEQNYPNPFNPITTFRYQLPVTSHVVLKVYDLLGREVTTLVDVREEAGYRSISWDATGLASGVYLYRLEATAMIDPQTTFQKVNKMILLK